MYAGTGPERIVIDSRPINLKHHRITRWNQAGSTNFIEIQRHQGIGVHTDTLFGAAYGRVTL